jgi:hypothetical protein
MATLDGMEVLYLSSKLEVGMIPDRLGELEPKVLTSPASTRCRIVGNRVVFERRGLREEIDMSQSRVAIQRRFLGWSVHFTVLNGKTRQEPVGRIFRNFSRHSSRPRIAGIDPRLTFWALVLTLLCSIAGVFFAVVRGLI